MLITMIIDLIYNEWGRELLLFHKSGGGGLCKN